jgi:hypothetical protein
MTQMNEMNFKFSQRRLEELHLLGYNAVQSGES